MTAKQRIMIGGLGALTPLLVSFLAVDYRNIFVGLTLVALLSYLLRIVVLFYLGGLVSYLHREETNRVKLFELGIVAPALITGFLNGTHVQTPNDAVIMPSLMANATSVIGLAYAQETPEIPATFKVEQVPEPRSSVMMQFWRGFTGAVETQPWQIVVAQTTTREEADRTIQDLLKKFPSRVFYIYLPSEHNQNYTIVLGEGAGFSTAESERRNAIAEGFPITLFLWQPSDIHVRLKVVPAPAR